MVISKDLFFSNFKIYFKNPIHDPYKNKTDVKLQIDEEFCFLNTILQINCICLVIFSSIILNKYLGILLG